MRSAASARSKRGRPAQYRLTGVRYAFLVLLGITAASAATARERQFSLHAATEIASSFGQVTSTKRTVAHNRAVGGVWNSHHLQGNAIDVARKQGVSHARIASALRTAGFSLIESLDEGDHSHFAFGSPGRGKPAVSAPATEAGPSPNAAPPKPVSPLKADQHGELWIDIEEAATAPSL